MRNAATLFGFFLTTLLSGIPALAQNFVPGFVLTGQWSGMYHEDELERTDPGPPPGDYTGFPLNEAGRMRADSWDGDLVSVLEHQSIPHPAPYSMRGPANLSIHALTDPATERLLAYVIEGTFGGATRTIWMDGRPHPGKYAPLTWGGFSTGKWEGDTLRVDTTHIKPGYLRRNGIMYSEQVTYTEFFDLHDKYLAVTTLVDDPVYLTEPLLRTETFEWNPYMQIANSAGYGATCQPQPELERPYGWVPHWLPGTNNVLTDYSVDYGIPFEATRGGAETMYPEYQKKLKTMTIPRPKIFDSMFEREHEAPKAATQEPRK